MSEIQETQRVTVELRSLRARMVALESRLQLLGDGAWPLPAARFSPATWGQEIFPAEITADHEDGTYEARRLVATGRNAFATDGDDPAEITVGNVAERGGYVGGLSVGDVVLVRFDGLTSQGEAIYHVW